MIHNTHFVFSSLRKSAKQPFDHEWYTWYQQCANFKMLHFLEGDGEYRNQQKQYFFRGKISCPVLDYPHLDQDRLKEIMHQLQQVQTKIMNASVDTEQMNIVQHLYRLRIEEDMNDVQLLLYAARRDMKRFFQKSLVLYGKPSIAIFHYILHGLNRAAKNQLASTRNRHQKKAAQIILQQFRLRKAYTNTLAFPNPECVHQVEHILQDATRALTKMIPPRIHYFTPKLIQPIFEKVLRTLQASDWKVYIHPHITVFNVDPTNKVVNIPLCVRIQRLRLKQIIVHELAVHVNRHVNGLKSTLLLLGLGLHHNNVGEEGAATVVEQCVTGKSFDFSGLDKYLALCLAVGLDGKKRNFHQIFSLMQQYYLFYEFAAGADALSAVEEAREKAYKICIRIFRGTDCHSAGIVFLKESIYAAGNIRVWNVLEKDPTRIPLLFQGKFDISNRYHIRMLSRLGMF